MIQVLNRAFDVLEAIANRQAETPATLSRHLGLPISTVVRILNSLESRGFVEQEIGGRRYHIGRYVLALSNRVPAVSNPALLARPILKELNEETLGDAGLSVLYGSEALILDRVFGPDPLKIIERLPMRVPLTCGCFRKILLAYQDDKWIEDYLSRINLERYTEYTLTSKEDVLREITGIRKLGFSVSFEEYLLSAGGIGAPFFGPDEKISGAIWVTFPMVRLTPEWIPRIINSVVKAGHRMTERLTGRQPRGWQPITSVSDPRLAAPEANPRLREYLYNSKG